MASATQLCRATNISGLRERAARLISPEGFAKGLAFRPRTNDVFIATFPKCGTTLLQQIVHGLRTKGDMDFVEITEVIPWIELAHDMDLDPEDEQKADPRAYKTHLAWDLVPKGGRYIYVIRDPLAVVVSFYHFFEGWYFETGSIDFESFALEFVLPGTQSRRYWEHLASWWPQRSSERVLFLCYEDIVRNLRGSVERVASFIGLDTDAERIDIASRQADIEFMAGYPTLWDDNLLRAKRNEACGIPADSATTKVRGPSNKQTTEMTPAVKEAWDLCWSEIVEPATGHASYGELRRAIAQQ